jgi:hypothetical protein
VNPPARSIRTELNDAVVGGIRQRGPDAVGLLIMAAARIVIAVVVLGLLFVASSLLGYPVTTWPFVGMTGISGLVSWLTTRDRRQGKGADPVRP